MKMLSPAPGYPPHLTPERADMWLSMLIDGAGRVVVPVVAGALIVAVLALVA